MKNATDNYQAALARREDLVVQEIPDEVLVYDLKRHKAHCLNKTAAFVWNHCDGQTSVAEMAGLLQQEVGEPVDQDVIWYALDKLSKADLLEAQPTPPVKDGLSRRRMVRKLGAGALVAIPAVISLVAPTAVQAITFITTKFRIADGQCTQQDNPVNCDDRCCTGSNKICVAPMGSNNFACLGPPCISSGPASPCTPN